MSAAAVPLGRTRRIAVLLLWLAALAAAAAVIAHTRFSADLSAFLPQSPDARQRVLTEQLQSGVASRTLMLGIDGGADAAERARLSKALAATMRASGLFEQVQNGETSDWKEAGELLFRYRYVLSPDVTPQRFTVAGLHDAIADTLFTLGTPAGNATRDLLERDPTGETRRIAEALIPSRSPRVEDGVWVSRQQPRAVLLATTRAAGSDLDAQALAIAQVQQAFDSAAHTLGARSARLQLSGTPVFSVQSRDRIKSEAMRLATIGAGVMGAILLLTFASPRALLLALLPVATGVVGGTAAVALAFGNVHGLTLGFGSTLIGETVDYAIYYLIQARPMAIGVGVARGGGWRYWRDRHWPTVRLGLLTSVCGFAALVFSGFPGLEQLGVFSLAGLIAAALATRFVLPVLAPDGAPGVGLRPRLGRWTQAASSRLPMLRPFALVLGAAALALLLWQSGSLWRGNLGSMSPIPQAEQDLNGQLRDDIGASDGSTIVVVQADSEQAVLRAAEAAATRLEPLIDSGVLAGFDSVTRVLPSAATQRARLAALPDAQVLTQRLAEAMQGLPLKAERLQPFIDDVQAARVLGPVSRQMLAHSPLGALVHSLLLERPGGGWSALISLHAGPRFDADRLAAALSSQRAAQVIDIGKELNDLYARYQSEVLLYVSLGALAVVALLAANLRSVRRLLAVCQPLALAVLLTLGGFAAGHLWLGWPALGILHLVGLLLVVAVGSNYALFFDQLQQDRVAGAAADPNTLASLALANLTTVMSFGLIALSEIPALSSIGRVVAPGALLALLLAGAFGRPRARGRSAAGGHGVAGG